MADPNFINNMVNLDLEKITHDVVQHIEKMIETHSDFLPKIGKISEAAKVFFIWVSAVCDYHNFS